MGRVGLQCGGRCVIEAKRNYVSWSQSAAELAGFNAAIRAPSLWYAIAKRALDVVFATALLLILLPVMALLALAVRLDSPGGPIFRQKRVGLRGREFVMYKFRSMVANADESVHRKFASDYINGNGSNSGRDHQASSSALYKPNGDRRITRVGRWLRRTSLDELPQLVNVIRGEMSLVGPRPAVPYEVEQYSRWHLKRLAVLPGLTGLAQISGRSGLTFERIVQLDVGYIEKRSLRLDLIILLRTIPVVLRAKCVA